MDLYIRNHLSILSHRILLTITVLVLLAAAGCTSRPTTEIDTTTQPSMDTNDNTNDAAADSSPADPDTEISDIEEVVPEGMETDVDGTEQDLEDW